MKAPLFVALAAILATLLPVAGAQAQTTCPSIFGVVTGKVTLGANQKCTLESSGRINIESDNSSAFFFSGARSKVINYGNINLRGENNAAFELTSAAENAEIEFLSGSVNVESSVGINYFLYSDANKVKLTFGGTASIGGETSYFYRDATFNGTDDEVILLPGAVIHNGDPSRPLAGVYSAIGESAITTSNTDVLKIGNFYDGDEPVDDRRGWVHAGQWDFGTVNQRTHQLIVDTNPGVRFSNRGGINHYRSQINTQNAIFGLHLMDIRSGNVVLGGSVWMPNGKVYIHDAGRLTFEIGKRRDAPSTRIGEMTISRLVADQVIFTGDNPRVFMQFAHYLSASDIAKFRNQLAQNELFKLDAATNKSDGTPLSRIFLVNDVFYNQNISLRTRTNLLKVASSGSSGIQDVGYIGLRGLGIHGFINGYFTLIEADSARNIEAFSLASFSDGLCGEHFTVRHQSTRNPANLFPI